MKRIALLFVLASNLCLSQTNREVIFSFVDSQVGKKVGSGICFDLVDSSYSRVNPLWKNTLKNGQYYYGKKVKLKDVQVGDAILIWNKGVSHKLTPNHIGVVYSVDGDKVTVAHQNVGEKLKDSKVVLSLIEVFDKRSIEIRRL